jgi:uncharacterized membrane protein
MITEIEHVQSEIKRLDGKLYEIFVITDNTGKEVQRINVPLKVELKIHDILEILVGASILAVPTAFTEEVWNMGDELSWINVSILSFVSVLFMGTFIYFTSYRKKLKLFRKEYFKRVLFTYLLALLVVGFLLTVVDKCPWFTDFDLALKRTLIGAFPASLSATVTDNIS